MAFSLGLSAKKSKSTTDETFDKLDTETGTETSTPNAPDWYSQPWQSLFGKGAALGDMDPSSFIPGATGNQKLAFNRAPTLGATGGAYLGDAAAAIKAPENGMAYGYNPAEMTAAQAGPASHAEAARSIGYLGDYQNPFEDQVVQGAIGDMDRGRKLAAADAGHSAIIAGGYGGSRQGVVEKGLNRDFLDRVGSVSGNLRSQGFGQALSAADSDANRVTGVSTFNAGSDNDIGKFNASLAQQGAIANQGAKNQAWQYGAGANDTAAARRLQAAGMLGDIGQTSGSEDRANLATLGDIGGVERGILGEQAAAPLTLQQYLAQLLNQAPTDAFVGRTNNSSSTGTSTGKSTSVNKSKGIGVSASVGK
jgi:hypothetical protein